MLEALASEQAVREAIEALGARSLSRRELQSPPSSVLYVFHDGMKHRFAFGEALYPVIPDCALLAGQLEFGRLTSTRIDGVTAYFSLKGTNDIAYGFMQAGGFVWTPGKVRRGKYDCNEGNIYLPPPGLFKNSG